MTDTIDCDQEIDPEDIETDVRDLARLLANMDPTRFGLLSCYGAVKQQRAREVPHSYDLLFIAPRDLTNPRSLRDVFLGDLSKVTLNERVGTAVGLARAVLFLHTSHFVHKSIRPENIVIFRNESTYLGQPFLLEFEKFRLDDTVTRRNGDDDWEKNLYRHPQRQGICPQRDFMQHDIYSLGVVLLELGIGTSFVRWPLAAMHRPTPDPSTGLPNGDSKKTKYGQAAAVKTALATLAQEKLPNAIGRKYTNVVLTCLTCLDKDNDNFNTNEIEDRDGVFEGVQFIDTLNKT